MNDLIDEQELRDALEAFRPDRDAFETGVQSRLKWMLQRDKSNLVTQDDSPWLRVAASMVPLSMFSKVASTSTAIPIGKISLGYKLIGYAALPALSVLVMVGATLIALFRIRKAHVSPRSDAPGAASQQITILMKWWKSYGLLPAFIGFVAVIVFLSGYTFPLFLFFLGSGIAMIALVTRLGHAGLIDRGSVGGALISSLMALAQVTQIASTFDSGCHLLDQSLVMMILIIAAMLLGLVLVMGKWDGWQTGAKAIGLGIGALVVFGLFGASIWSPMTIPKMRNQIESFHEARFSSATWKHWAVATVWLQQSGVPIDLSLPRALFQAEIQGEQNPFILGVASRTGLVTAADLSRVRDPFNLRKQLLDPFTRVQKILSIGQLEFAIREMVIRGPAREEELDHLESRLLATLRDVETLKLMSLDEALITTQLLAEIGRPCKDDSIRQLIQRQLVAMQRTPFKLGGRNGGFAAYTKLDHSDLYATTAAVELMENFGVPSELNIMAIRSFLRPSIVDFWVNDTMRTATRMRLEGLDDIPPLTFWDYVYHEPAIAMAIVFAMLCFFATVGCPNQSRTETLAPRVPLNPPCK